MAKIIFYLLVHRGHSENGGRSKNLLCILNRPSFFLFPYQVKISLLYENNMNLMVFEISSSLFSR